MWSSLQQMRGASEEAAQSRGKEREGARAGQESGGLIHGVAASHKLK